jgi:3-methyladenine DNA glycosylase AlkD
LRNANTQEVEKLEAEIVERISSLSSHTADEVRAVRRHYSIQIAKSPPEPVISLAVKLVDRSQIVFRWVAYELVLHHKQALKSLDAKRLERLGKGLDSWGAVDSFACYLAGPAWRERQVADKLIHGWTRSPDRWWRRAALVSTVALNCKARGGNGDATRTLKVCEMLVEDRDDMVVKAMSWALRELAKRDQTAVRDFLADHQEFLAPRVIREVNNKLRTGLKNPRSEKPQVVCTPTTGRKPAEVGD